MQISQSFYDLIVLFEGLKLQAYKDSANIPTIGIGTIKYPDGTRVKMGDTCTKEQAYQYLNHDLTGFIADVNRLAPNVTQNQFDALVSFQYNTGSLAGSTLLKRVNGAPGDIREAFLMWVKAKVNGKKVVVQGLVNRRNKEADLYLQ
jgi:lysozyme